MKLNSELKYSSNKDDNSELIEFLDIVNKHEDLVTKIKNTNMDENSFFQYFSINSEDKSSLISLIITHSMFKPSQLKNSENPRYTESDIILNYCLDLYKNLNIYYMEIEISKSESDRFRSKILKIIKIMILEGNVKSKKINRDGKTIELWSVDTDTINLVDYSNLKISMKPFKLMIINDNHYLIGSFFNNIQKIFVENIKSDHFFKLNDMSYIDNLIESPLFLNIYDLKDVTSLLRDKYGDEENIVYKINNNADKINEIESKIVEISTQNRNIYHNQINNEIALYFTHEINEKLKYEEFPKNRIVDYIFSLFYNYCNDFFKKKSDVVLNDKDIFLKWIYYKFQDNFQNAHFKSDFSSMDEFNNWKHNLEKYGIYDITENEIIKERKFKKIDNTTGTVKITKKIEASDISLINYLFIFSKKEIEGILKKNIKKIEREMIKISDNPKNSDKINEYDDKNYNLLYYITYKYNLFEKTKEYKENSKKIVDMKFDIKTLMSDNSKISHKYNVLMLEKYILDKCIHKVDEHGNIRIYFPFFFDFRGRFYYNSPISPTNNRYCRVIYNYGVTEIKEYLPNEMSVIIVEYIKYINIFKKLTNIESSDLFINESIFWIMISIGKIIMNKDKTQQDTQTFLKSAIFLIENKHVFKDELDELEYLYYLKIVDSLKQKKFIRRVLIKDASASFFQNLIRILGEKDEITAEKANLISNKKAWSWYACVLEWWVEDEIKNNKYDPNINKYFNRKNTKKIIMTLPYSSTIHTCFEYFQDSVYENCGTRVYTNDEIGTTFVRFFKFTNSLMSKKNGPFKTSPDELMADFQEILKSGENIKITSRDDDVSNLTYYKMKQKHFDFIIKHSSGTKRVVKNYSIIDKSTIDTKKTTTAAKANLVHFVDAMLVRDINKDIHVRIGMNFVSIHDAFLVDFTYASNFMIIANIQINKNPLKDEKWHTDKKYSSIYIFI